MLKVIAACGNGMGSSMVIKLKITKVFKKLGIGVTVDHSSVGEAKNIASKYDMVFVSQAFVSQFSEASKSGTKIVGLKNLLSEQEIEEKIKELV